MKSSNRPRAWLPPKSAFAGFRFPTEVIVVAVRWYLRFNLSYRDVEELLIERGVEVDHVSIYRWVQRFTPLLADAARFARHSPGDRWHVDETHVKVNGVCRLLATARHVHGARVLMHEIYGVGAMTSLALCAWLGGANRFSSSRRAVRFVGLDITVHSCDNKRSPGRLSRQGPEVLRWLLFEAAKTSARGCAPGYSYYTAVKERIDANRACLSQARRIVRQAVHLLADLGDEAFTIVAQPAAPSTIAR